MTTATKDVKTTAPPLAERIENRLVRNFGGERTDDGDIVKTDCPFCSGLKIGTWHAADQVFGCPSCPGGTENGVRYGVRAMARTLDVREDAPEVEMGAINEHAVEIRRLERRGTADTVEIGRRLRKVKKAIPRRFTSWAQDEFGWSQRSARLYMQVFDRFGETANFADLQFDQTALYLLSAKSTPPAATEEAIKVARGGTKVTRKLAKEIVAKHADEKPEPPPWDIWDGIHYLRQCVAELQSRWPEGESEILGQRLKDLGDEILEHGELRE